MRIAHLADIHIRLKDRQEEYGAVFRELYKSLKKEKPDRIVIAGDIFHSKIAMSPESVVVVRRLFTNLCNIAPLDIIAGNHDLNLSNMERLDALSPVVSTIRGTKNTINYYKKTGIYKIEDSNFYYGVFSLLDGKGLKLEEKEDGAVYIALFHGQIAGCKMDNGYMFGSEATSNKIFDGFDYIMAGDIHCRQETKTKGVGWYCGSLVQQNFGEEVDKGYLLWDITDRKEYTCKFIEVKNDHKYIVLDIDDGILPHVEIPAESRVRVIWGEDQNNPSNLSVSKISELVKEHYGVSLVSVSFKLNTKDKSMGSSISGDLSNENVQRDILKTWLEKEHGKDNISIPHILELDKKITEGVSTHEMEDFSNSVWDLKKISVDNFMSYGSKVEVDFSHMPGIIGLFGENAAGKSVIIDAIMYALFNKITRNVNNKHLVNRYTGKNTCTVVLDISINGVDYQIERSTTHKRNKDGLSTGSKTDVCFKRKNPDSEEWEDLKEDQRQKTEKIIRNAIGSFDDFVVTTLSPQNKTHEFLNQGPSARLDNILRFLGLDIYSRKYDLANNGLKEIKLRLGGQGDRTDELNVLISNLETEKGLLAIEEARVVDNKKEMKDKQEKLTTVRNGINTEIKIEKSCEELTAECGKIEKEMVALQGKKDGYVADADRLAVEIVEKEGKKIGDDELKELAAECEEIKKLTKEISKINDEIKSDKKLLMLYRDDFSRGNKCPVSYDEKHVTCPYLSAYVEKKTDCSRLLKKVEELSAQVVEKENRLRALDGVLDRFNEQLEISEGISALKKSLEETQKNIRHTTEMLEIKSFSLNLVQEQLSLARSNVKILSKNAELRKKEKLLIEEMDQINDKIEAGNRVIVLLEKNISVLEKSAADVGEDILKYKMVAAEHLIYTMYLEAIHRDAIPTFILNKCLPDINNRVNMILSDVVNFEIRLEADDSKNMEISMHHDGIEQDGPAQTSSGMERLLIDMAIRYSLLSISTLNRPNVWIIDEGFGALDSSSLAGTLRFFENIRGSFKNIILITHIDALKDVADWVLDIEKTDRVSKITCPLANI